MTASLYLTGLEARILERVVAAPDPVHAWEITDEAMTSRHTGVVLRSLRERGLVVKAWEGPPAGWRATDHAARMVTEARNRGTLEMLRRRAAERRSAALAAQRDAERLWEWADSLTAPPTPLPPGADLRAPATPVTFNAARRILEGLVGAHVLVTSSTPGVWPPCAPMTAVGTLNEVTEERGPTGMIGTPDQEIGLRVGDGAFVYLSRVLSRGITWADGRGELLARQAGQLVEILVEDGA